MDSSKKQQFTLNQLRSFRLGANLTQGGVAFLLGIKNIGRISEWENGLSRPSIEHLFGLSLIYNRLPDQLYPGLRKAVGEKIAVRRKLLEERRQQSRVADESG